MRNAQAKFSPSGLSAPSPSPSPLLGALAPLQPMGGQSPALPPAPGGSAARRLLGKARQYLPDVFAFFGALASAAVAAVVVGSLHGCGGGVGGEGTGSFALGPISGFGSIVVNGVRFDDSAAQVLDDDGATADRTRLALGTVVQVQAGAQSTDASGQVVATAQQVQVMRALVGPVDSVNAAAGTLRVLGQQVRLAASTVLDGSLAGGLAGLSPGRVVEVYGSYDSASQSYVATRIGLASSGESYRVRGTVAAVDTTRQTFQLGGQTFSLSQLGSAGGVSAGAVVQVKIASSRDAENRWVVQQQRPGTAAPTQDGVEMELKGIATQVLAGSLVVDGVKVDTSRATVQGNLREGVNIEVEGVLRSGVLVATKVQCEEPEQTQEFDIRGSIERVDAANQLIVVRGTTISYGGGGLKLDGGTRSDLTVGRSVRVKGLLSSDRKVVVASEIKFGG